MKSKFCYLYTLTLSYVLYVAQDDSYSLSAAKRLDTRALEFAFEFQVGSCFPCQHSWTLVEGWSSWILLGYSIPFHSGGHCLIFESCEKMKSDHLKPSQTQKNMVLRIKLFLPYPICCNSLCSANVRFPKT